MTIFKPSVHQLH